MARRPESAAAPGAPRSVVLFGCGAVGTALASALSRRGVPLALWSRTAGRAAALAARLEGAEAPVDTATGLSAAWDAGQPGRRVGLICVTDAALEPFVGELRDALLRASGAEVFLHTNGARGLDVLAPLAERGFGVGKIHPLVAVPPPAEVGAPRDAERAADALRDAWFATCSSEAARATVEGLLACLGARALPIAADDASSLRLHAAAALLSGGLVALHATAVEIAAAGERSAVDEALRALLTSTARNVSERGATGALTGPTARGAPEVVRGHLVALDALDPEAAAAYRLLGRRMLMLALERGTVDAVARAELERLLAD